MSVKVFDPAMGLDHLKGEKSVLIYQGEDDFSVEIHPWERDYRDMGVRLDREVAIKVGHLDSEGNPVTPGEDYEIAIVNKDDFIEAILAVFPELTRAEGHG